MHTAATATTTTATATIAATTNTNTAATITTTTTTFAQKTRPLFILYLAFHLLIPCDLPSVLSFLTYFYTYWLHKD